MTSNGLDQMATELEHTSNHIDDTELSKRKSNNHTEDSQAKENEESAAADSSSDSEEEEEDSEFEDPDDLMTKLRKSTEAVPMLYLLQPMVEVLKSVEIAPNDVIIAGFPKSGTNWLEQICHQIKMKGADEEFEELTDEVPLLQLCSVPLGYDLNVQQKGDFKLFKTHDILMNLPGGANKCKRVIMLRNPHNTLSSYYRWEPQFTGYDPRCEVTIEQFFEYKFNYKSTRMPLTYWDFVATWVEDCKNEEHCLFIFYEDLCENFDKVCQKLLEFLGTTLTPSQTERVKYLSSFDYMKANESKFDLHGLREKIAELAATEDYYLEKSTTPSFLNLGAKRNAKNEIPQRLLDIMAKEWQENITEKFGYKDYEEMRRALGCE